MPKSSTVRKPRSTAKHTRRNDQARKATPKTCIYGDATAAHMVKDRRRQERSVRTRQKILNAATTEFASLGFGSATTRSIAERAGVPYGLVIYHFKSKLAMWQAVMESVFEYMRVEFVSKIAPFVYREDPVGALRAFHRAFIEGAAARPEFAWLMSHEVGGGSDRMKWFNERDDVSLLLWLIGKAQKLGRYMKGDPAHVHYLFVGAAGRAFMVPGEIERTMHISPFDKGFIEEHIKLCGELFFRDPPSGRKQPLMTRPAS